VRAKVPVADTELFATLLRGAAALDVPLAATGTASVTRYAVMQRGPVLSVYCAEPRSLLERVAGDTGDRFPNVEIIEVREPVSTLTPAWKTGSAGPRRCRFISS
jgi:hypothetical protein